MRRSKKQGHRKKKLSKNLFKKIIFYKNRKVLRYSCALRKGCTCKKE